MQSQAISVDQYLAELPDDRRPILEAVRAAILKNLPTGYAEGMQYGMIGYFVPHDLYPDGYHCDPSQPLPFVSLASQKNHCALYIGLDEEFDEWFREAWLKTGKKMDRGKCCVRFKRIEDVPLSVVGRAVKRIPVKKLIAHYETHSKPTRQKATSKPTRSRKASSKKVSAKKSSVRSSPAKAARHKKKTSAS